MPTLWIFDIEPHEQRYTGEWKEYLPKQLESYRFHKNLKNWHIEVVDTVSTRGNLPKGAFLNFAETNVYKSYQISAFAINVDKGRVKKGDRVLFTDAWHPGVINCRYMSDLLDLDLSIDVMWHAGSYDKHDLLAQKVSNNKWSYAFERSIFEAADQSYFATEFHKKMFMKTLRLKDNGEAKVVGWPMEYLPRLLKGRHQTPNKDLLIFPHRMSDEKQWQAVDILRPLLGTYKIVFAQSKPRTKSEYHDLLGQSLVCFSASKQETLGIGTYEAMLCGAVPIVPMRLSYEEIYPSFCYPSIWTSSLKNVSKFAPALAAHILNVQSVYQPKNNHQMALKIGKKYFDGEKLYAQLFRK